MKVLLIEDDYFARIALTNILKSDGITVITAKNEEEIADGLKKKPSVVILSATLKSVGSLDILHDIMKNKPAPTIMTASHDTLSANDTVQALLHYGALDVIAKPASLEEMGKDKEKILSLVKKASETIPKKQTVKPKKIKVLKVPATSGKIVVIGASTGGPPAVQYLLEQLPKKFPAAVLVIIHLPATFTKQFVERIKNKLQLPIAEAKEGDVLSPNKILLAPGSRNIEVVKKHDRMVISLYTSVEGDLAGNVVSVLFSKRDACLLADLMQGKKKGTTEILSEEDQDALKELGDILAGSFLTALANFLHLNLRRKKQKFAYVFGDAVPDLIMNKVAEKKSQEGLLLKTEFFIKEIKLKGDFTLMIVLKSLKPLLKSIDRKLKEN